MHRWFGIAIFAPGLVAALVWSCSSTSGNGGGDDAGTDAKESGSGGGSGGGGSGSSGAGSSGASSSGGGSSGAGSSSGGASSSGGSCSYFSGGGPSQAQGPFVGACVHIGASPSCGVTVCEDAYGSAFQALVGSGKSVCSAIGSQWTGSFPGQKCQDVMPGLVGGCGIVSNGTSEAIDQWWSAGGACSTLQCSSCNGKACLIGTAVDGGCSPLPDAGSD